MGTPGDKTGIGKVVRDEPSSPDPQHDQRQRTTTPSPLLSPVDRPSTSSTAEMGRLPHFQSLAALDIQPSRSGEKTEQSTAGGLGQATIEDYFVQAKYYPSLSESISSLDEPGPSGLQAKRSRTRKGKKQQPTVLECPVCRRRFANAGRLAKHQQAHGGAGSSSTASASTTSAAPYKCEHCKKTFTSRFKLVRHALIHSDRRPFSCQVCERTFHRKDHLKNHIKVHSPSKKVYSCDKVGCNKEYTSLLSFRKHLALHSAEEGGLECQICFDVFETKEEILHHLKIHAGSRTVKNPSEKKFTCEHCDRKFFTKKDVRRHLVVHTGMRDFLCQFCPQRFGRKDHLVRHIKKSHHTRRLTEATETAPIETVMVKTEVPEATAVKIETTSESSVSNPEQFNPLEFGIETFGEADLIFGQPMGPEQLQYLPSTSSRPPAPVTPFLGDLAEPSPSTSNLPDQPVAAEDINPRLLEEAVLMQDSEIIRLLESTEDKNLPLPGFSQTFQSPPPPP